MKTLLLAVLLAAVASGPASAAGSDFERARLGNELVLMRTNRGDLVLGFYPELAPRHTAQILKLVRLGVYDSTFIHRVEPNFVAQLTNAQNRKLPLSPEQRQAITKLPAEISGLRHQPGLLSMAREDGDLNSAETSFSFMLAAAPHLDGKYTIFGQLVAGMPLLHMIASEPRDEKNGPRTPVVVESARVITGADLARMRLTGEFRDPVPLSPAAAVAATSAPQAATAPAMVTVGLLLIIACNLVSFLFGSRWPPQTQGAVNLLGVLIAAFLIVAQHGPGSQRNPLLAVALFFGIVALLKLMNRFESAPRVERRT
jgi:peptidyl-prolyl cis-trans isomerase B (cyclophilin B)